MGTPRRLLAVCPRTGRWLDTGLAVRDEVLTRLERLESSVFCPYCGDLHRWTRETVALEGELSMEGTGVLEELRGKREGTTNAPV